MRYLAFILSFCFSVNLSFAQDVAISATDKTTDDATEVSAQCENCLTESHEVIKVIDNSNSGSSSKKKAFAFPDCNNPQIIRDITAVLSQEKLTLKDDSVVNLRSKLLARRNFNRFSLIPIDEFKPQDNYDIANLLISLKINQGMNNDDFNLCVSDNRILKRRIWQLMIRRSDYVQVNIINYKQGEIPSFNYVP